VEDKAMFRNAYCFCVALLIAILTGQLLTTAAHGSSRDSNWPKFGLAFQNVKNYDIASQRFGFLWQVPWSSQISNLSQRNKQGIYVPDYNLFQTTPLLSNKCCPDYHYITIQRPEWILRYKDGSPITVDPGKFEGLRLDLGNPQYLDWAIEWINKHAFTSTGPNGALGLDNGMFMFADKRWAKYDTNEAYRDAWEYFLRRISEALRPQHKVILNVGGCDLPTFARMIRWVDGVLHEDLCTPAHDLKFNSDKARQAIQDRWQKGQWCAENGKIWAVRYRSTVAALKLTPAPGTPSFFLSVGDRDIIVSSLGQQVLGKIDLTRPNADTVGKVAKCLKDFNINVTVATPYPETPSPGAFQPLTYTKVAGGLTMKLKQAPREAFLFGYAAVLMAAGPNSYFILGDERNQEYYYPEMDWKLGAPQGEMREVAPQVFRRDFKNYAAFLNLSQASFTLPDSRVLAPFRGALVPVPR
jgi:hypothetical protein